MFRLVMFCTVNWGFANQPPVGSSAVFASSDVEHRTLTAADQADRDNAQCEASGGLIGPSGRVCCELQCETCGGHGCHSRPGGGTGCCVGNILQSNRICEQDGAPPCVLLPVVGPSRASDDDGSDTESPTPSPNFHGHALQSCSFVFILTFLVLRALEENVPGASACFSKLNFEGAALLQGHVWVLITSGFLHDSWSHALKESLWLVLCGVASEIVGPATWLFIYFGCGVVGVLVSWYSLRERLAREFDDGFGRVTADLTPSRGGSANCFGVGALGCVVAGRMPLHSALGVPVVAARVVAIAARVVPEFVSQKSRFRRQPAVMIMLLMPLFTSFMLWGPSDVSVSGAASIFLFINGLFIAFPKLRTEEPAGIGAPDHASHLGGAATAAVLGWCWRMWQGPEAETTAFAPPWISASHCRPLGLLIFSELIAPKLPDLLQKLWKAGRRAAGAGIPRVDSKSTQLSSIELSPLNEGKEDDEATMSDMKEHLLKGILIKKYSVSSMPMTLTLKSDEDCTKIFFENQGVEFRDGDCDTYKLSDCGIRRATDPDPDAKHFAGSKVLRDSLDPDTALEAFIIEGPNKVAINCKAASALEAGRIINGFRLIFKAANARPR